MFSFPSFSVIPGFFATLSTFTRVKHLTALGAVVCVVFFVPFFASITQAQPVDHPAYPGIGRLALPNEIKAWDIDVRPDFKGLPAGAGSVIKGQEIYETQCASCHGIFGESNEVFSPLIGGTTAEDIKTGHVANLRDTNYPGRTTMMKVATLSTLWDYINRAMPWNAPKTLKTDEVYAVLAYMLNLADIVPEDFTLSNKNIVAVQARMPNRNGMTTEHNLWPGDEFNGVSKPDTANVVCMQNCTVNPKVASFLPAHARNNHGNLAQQNRIVGAQLGVNTRVPEGQGLQRPVLSDTTDTTTTPAPTRAADSSIDTQAVMALLQSNNCLACHGVTTKLVGPGFADIAKKYPGQTDYLRQKILSGSAGVWGAIPMPAQNIDDAQARQIAQWLALKTPQE